MISNIELLIAIISFGAPTLGYFFLIERRLTRVETKLDNHCKDKHNR